MAWRDLHNIVGWPRPRGLSAQASSAKASAKRVPVSDLISVIVTTYNREDALDAVLRSLACQSDRDFEVVVADDGSTAATAAVIDAWTGKIGRRLDHVWHEDRGFRAAEIRNRAILAARGVYCVFLDGDCIARPDFVAAHRRLAEPGCFVTGNRILLSRDLTAEVLREQPHAGDMDLWPLAGRTPARRHQPAVGAAASAARAAAAAAAAAVAGRALLQSGDLARRPRPRRRLRRRLQRLGQGGFRHHRAPAACRRAAQGRRVRHRRHSSVACRSRSGPVGRERAQAF